MQKSELWRRYGGKRIQWTGEVYQIEGDSVYVRMNQATSTYDVSVLLRDTTNILNRIREKYKAGDTIIFQGTFPDSETGMPIKLGYGHIGSGH